MKIKQIFCLFTLVVAVYSCSEDTIDLERKGTIEGTVVDIETGLPIDAVKITTNPGSTTTITNDKGEFILPNILIDDYSVQAEKENYTTGFEAVAVNENDTSVVVFELEESDLNNKAPQKPVLSFPEDGSVGIDLNVELIWESAETDDDELTYTIELRNGQSNALETFEVVADTTLLVEDLKLATNYFWTVTASDGISESVSSSVSQFSTLTAPNNPYLFVREVNGNNIIFSGNEDPADESNPDFNLYQLTDETKNSFRPRRNNEVNSIAFLRTIGTETHIFTMNEDGSNLKQVTNTIPIAGFNLNYLDFSWGSLGGTILYPNFDKLYSINPNGGSSNLVYTTSDGSLISEVDVAELDPDLLVIKTNDLNGYNVRIFTYRISTATEENVILDNALGAAGSIDISANGDQILYSLDTSGSENSIYRLFASRLFIYRISTGTTTTIETDATSGQNDFDARFSPSEGAVIFTRSENNVGATPGIYRRSFDAFEEDDELFINAFMIDWQ